LLLTHLKGPLDMPGLIEMFFRAPAAALRRLSGYRLGSTTAGPCKSIFFLSCRIAVGERPQLRKYRATYLVRRARYVEAEAIARGHLAEYLRQHSQEFAEVGEIRWLKGRLVSSQPRLEETPGTLRLLIELRKGSHEFVSAIERIDTEQGRFSQQPVSLQAPPYPSRRSL